MNGISAQLNVQRGGFTLAAAFELPSTGVSALFGASGSGKTTCLRALAGLERLPNSRIQVGDEVWQDEAKGIFIPPHLREIGYVFQEASLFSHLNVKKNLLFGHNRLPPAQRKVSMDTVVELLGIQNLLKRPPSALSGGERQRVAIARALLTSPKLLLMDEPLSALDLTLKQEILPYLENLHLELSIPIIYVSHAADEVARLADHIVLLEKGSVVAEGPLTQVMTDHHSAALFGDGVSTLLEGKISEQLPDQHLTIVSINSLALKLTQRSLKIGSALRCRVYASDVSVSLTQPSDSSILNTFQGQVERIDSTKNPGEVLLTLRVSEQQPLLAQISFHSLKRLNIVVGMRLWAQVKSVAVL